MATRIVTLMVHGHTHDDAHGERQSKARDSGLRYRDARATRAGGNGETQRNAAANGGRWPAGNGYTAAHCA